MENHHARILAMNATCCPDNATLQAYLLGQVDDEALDAHLDECSECRAMLETLDAAVNQPFACLRGPAAAVTDWQQASYQHLVTQAKALIAEGRDLPVCLPPGPRPSPLFENETDTFVNQTLGNYRLLGRVGAGGMGRVYKAIHQRLKKTVAVKLLSPNMRLSQERRLRFQREIEAVGRLASPHIVTAYDAGESDGRDFLVMEYVEGKNLAEIVQERGPLPIEQALDYVLQAARGLEHAHAAGIVHRDVTPANVLLDSSGTVKVLDLGLALIKFGETEPPSRCTSDTVIMGTVAFMAPEQALNTHQADEHADVYSLGCTLYFLLTGKAPYEATTPMEVLVAHRERPIPSLRDALPACPQELDNLFRRMVAKDPQARPASMKVVIAELERLVSAGGDLGSLRQISEVWSRPRRQFPWRGMIAAGIGVAACALLSMAFWPAGSNLGDQKNGATPPKKGVKPVIEMVRIEPGEFWMGALDTDRNAQPSEKPRRKIKINQPFFLGKTEVTQGQYEEVMGTNPSAFSKTGRFKNRVKDVDTSEHPVDSVSWLDAVTFANGLSQRHGLEPYYKIAGEVVTINGGTGYRLPTEAEWEYACRANTETTWYFGEKADDLKDHAWYADNSSDRTHPVGQKKANPWGLFDMYGNVPEWCWDRFDPEYYKQMPVSDPPGPGTGRERVFRGDAWNSLLPRTSARPALGFTYGGPGSINVIGFRLARNVE
jgi:formylglycine-generating enzyme required for sulfatase activity/tRNA A-37 threonylcarbamoyl transferase component Bud32